MREDGGATVEHDDPSYGGAGMAEASDKAANDQVHAGDNPSPRARSARLSLIYSLRLPQNGELLRRIVRAARARGVPPSTYVRVRIREIVDAELDGKAQVNLGSVEATDF